METLNPLGVSAVSNSIICRWSSYAARPVLRGARMPRAASVSTQGVFCMRMKKLGGTGLVVSEMALRTMTFSNGEGFWGAIGNTDQATATGIVKSAIDHGVNFIDTADVYSNG